MKRYDLITNYRAGSSIEEMEPSDDGEWVRYEEVAGATNEWIDCAICRQQNSFSGVGHWAWHRFCRAEVNPIALIAFIDRNSQPDAADKILRYVVAITGMNLKAVRQAMDEEMSANAVDPHVGETPA